MTAQTMKMLAPGSATPAFGRTLGQVLATAIDAFAEGLAAAHTYESLRNRSIDPQVAVSRVFEQHFTQR